MGSNGSPRHQVESEQSPIGRSKDRALAPQVTRVDTDPSQQYAWQKETTVRHIQEPSVSFNGNTNQNTPPQQQWHGQDAEQPTYLRNDDNTQPDTQRREYRNSGWGRSQNNGSVGVTGAG
jgi:hypothetical protein